VNGYKNGFINFQFIPTIQNWQFLNSPSRRDHADAWLSFSLCYKPAYCQGKTAIDCSPLCRKTARRHSLVPCQQGKPSNNVSFIPCPPNSIFRHHGIPSLSIIPTFQSPPTLPFFHHSILPPFLPSITTPPLHSRISLDTLPMFTYPGYGWNDGIMGLRKKAFPG